MLKVLENFVLEIQGGGSGGVKKILLLLLLSFLLKNPAFSRSFFICRPNFQVPDVRWFIQKFTLIFFFLMSFSVIKEPITGFCASKCFTSFNNNSIFFFSIFLCILAQGKKINRSFFIFTIKFLN